MEKELALLSPSGSEIHPQSFSFRMEDLSQVGEARRFALGLCAQTGLDEIQQGRVAIIINELGNNLVKYALRGQLILRVVEFIEGLGIEILSIDQGPGLPNIDQVMSDGFSTGSTPGTGLGAVQRQSSEFDIYSTPGKGTVIVSLVHGELKKSTKYNVGAVNIPLEGEEECGDSWSTVIRDEDISLMMVDGLGHGRQAAQAAREAVVAFETNSSSPLTQSLQVIHNRLKSTRGGAVFLIRSENGNEVSFTGVGNIRALIQTHGGSKTLISQNGTAGLQMRSVKVLNQAWDHHGVLILHSDGINSRWNLADYPGILMRHPAVIAGIIYRDFNRGNDDATVLVIGKKK